MKCPQMMTVFTLVCGAVAAAARSPAAEPATSILLLTADDLGCESVGCFGNKTPDITPHIDRLAGQGLRFTQAFSTCNVCQPSRSVWITGRYPARNGAVGFNPITAGVPMLGEQMRKHGYFTGLMGKVEHFAPVGPEHWDFISRRVSLGRKPHVYAEELTKFFRQAAAAGKPFFVICNIHDPHRPFHKSQLEKKTGGDKINTPPSREYTAAEVDVPGYLPDTPEVRDELVCYYDTVKRCDDTVGLALGALDAAGLADSVLVMFLSDNGAPLPFGKGSVYAHSTRTPWIVRWPKHVQAAVDCMHFISGIDLMPTVLEIAGAPQPPYMDGRSFLPVLQGQKQQWRDHAHCVFHRDQFRVLETRSLHTAKYDYLFNAWSDGKIEFVSDNNLGIMLPAARKDPAIQQRVDFYLHRAPEELYDVAKDPWALKNVLDDPAYTSVLAEMRKHMLAHLEETGDPNTWTLRFYLQDHNALDSRPHQRVKKITAAGNGAPASVAALHAVPPPTPHVDLREMLVPSPLRDVASGSVRLSGKAEVADGQAVRVRVTTSLGCCFETETKASGKRFACRYPQDFAGAPALSPMLLYVDATDAAEFGGKDMLEHQTEALLIVAGSSRDEIPDLPLVFTDDFVDARGKKDAQSAQWPRNRSLVNLFMRSRGAKLMGIAQPDFDLAKPADFTWFKEHATLYDFAHRDRDWSQPLGNRVARGFWQAQWNTWFNRSNDHPWDGNPENHDTSNYRPYAFVNDIADILVLYQLRRKLPRAVADNRDAQADEVLNNVLAMQHRSADNFALREASGHQECYTAGAFRYGMFTTGQWLTEGVGWFANPKFRDFVRGGVLNGRCVWALAESLKAQPDGPLAARIKHAIALTLRFCLHDGIAHQYTRLTPAGRPVWGGIPGEHAYLLLGMLAAAEVVPELSVELADDQPARPLRAVCAEALDALLEIALADGTWSHYANVDATNIAALASGSRVLSQEEGATRWKAAAARAADVWIALKPLPEERTAPTPLFGHRKEAGMTYYLGNQGHPHMCLYMNGLWLQALADLGAVTHDARYADRAYAILAYYCGNNPLHARILDELGGVNNRVTDADHDGIEEELRWNAYPESTAFVQIGLLHCLNP